MKPLIIQNGDIKESKNLTLDYLNFNTEYEDGVAEGRLQWNNEDGTLEFGMPGGDVNLQVGQEELIRVRNNSGVNILNGQAVYISGSTGAVVEVSLAKADSDDTGMVTGIATEDIDNNSFGYITVSGLVRDINTNSFTAGDVLYLSPDTAGAIVNVAPEAPNCIVRLGTCVVKGIDNGSILVRIELLPNFKDLCDINGTTLTESGQIPVWDNNESYFDFTKNINDFVPYTGATADVDLGENGLIADGLTSVTYGYEFEEWTAQNYVVDDEVRHNGFNYICIDDASPTDEPGIATDKWEEEGEETLNNPAVAFGNTESTNIGLNAYDTIDKTFFWASIVDNLFDFNSNFVFLGDVQAFGSVSASKIFVDTDDDNTALNINGGIWAGAGDNWNGGNLGGGIRMMWIPGKYAFRAGSVVTDQWDSANIGDGSVAFGSNNIASGSGAFAGGSNSTASGDNSLAFGSFSVASGIGAVALGVGAKALDVSCFAFGNSANADTFSIALGDGSVAESQSVAIGLDASANNGNDVAIGLRSSASGGDSVAIGRDSSASGFGSISIGIDTSVIGVYSSNLGGNLSIVNGQYSSNVGGLSNHNSGEFSFTAGGSGNEATGNYTSAISSIDCIVSGFSSSAYNSRYTAIDGDGAIGISSNNCMIGGYGAYVAVSEECIADGYGAVIVNSIYSSVTGFGSSVYNSTAVNIGAVWTMAIDSVYAEIEDLTFFNFLTNTINSIIRDPLAGLPISDWADDTGYTAGNYVRSDANFSSTNFGYVCIQSHTSSEATRPESGENWADYWQLFTSARSVIIGGDNIDITGAYNSNFNGIGNTIGGNFNYSFGSANTIVGDRNMLINLRQAPLTQIGDETLMLNGILKVITDDDTSFESSVWENNFGMVNDPLNPEVELGELILKTPYLIGNAYSSLPQIQDIPKVLAVSDGLFILDESDRDEFEIVGSKKDFSDGMGIVMSLVDRSFQFDGHLLPDEESYEFEEYYSLGSDSLRWKDLFVRESVESQKIKLTPEGGFAIKLTNRTGANSVKGSVVRVDTSNDSSFILAPANSDEAIGVVYESGIGNGQDCWIVKSGIADVLLKDGTASTAGNWVDTSDAVGRADATNTDPIPAFHWQEIGHCLETKSAGTNVLAKVVLHFN